MERVASFNSAVEANQAVAYLIDAGIPAKSIGWANALAPIGTLRMPRFTVFVNPPDRQRAQALLAELGRTRMRLDPDWEAQALPDLSCLPEDVEAPCPACGQPLPLDAALQACPACSSPANPIDILIERYGPEVLADCYPADSDVPQELLDQSSIACPACGYVLTGLPSEGICPECGERYSKPDILRGL